MTYHSGNTKKAILAALDDGDKSSSEIMAAVGKNCRGYLAKLVDDGLVSIVGSRRVGARIATIYGKSDLKEPVNLAELLDGVTNFDLYKVVCEFGRTKVLGDFCYGDPMHTLLILDEIGRDALFACAYALLARQSRCRGSPGRSKLAT